jgi:hypothetical protein
VRERAVRTGWSGNVRRKSVSISRSACQKTTPLSLSFHSLQWNDDRAKHRYFAKTGSGQSYTREVEGKKQPFFLHQKKAASRFSKLKVKSSRLAVFPSCIYLTRQRIASELTVAYSSASSVNAPPAKNGSFLRCHLYIKSIILPRQARDKHWENSKKDAVFRTVLSLIGRRLSEQVGRCADRALNRESLGILLA